METTPTNALPTAAKSFRIGFAAAIAREVKHLKRSGGCRRRLRYLRYLTNLHTVISGMAPCAAFVLHSKLQARDSEAVAYFMRAGAAQAA
jgi:hypothetical protein